MGLEIDKPQAGDKITIDRTLWLTAERDRVVEDGDPAAAFLYATAGKRVSAEEAERFGAMPAKSERKKADPSEDKQASPAENKSSRRRSA